MSSNSAAVNKEEIFRTSKEARSYIPADAPVVIRFDHVTKQYKLYRNDRARFLSSFSSRVPFDLIKANDDISFEIKKGEAVAFLGYNGAGKSTALKMVTGVSNPTAGSVQIEGKVSAMLELTAGFDPQLTGRENIHMRCKIWGLSKEETEAVIPNVEEFAQIGQFINHPMRTYSSGMKARLGFAFASAIKPDILVMDEVLAVGDRKFKQKCLARINEILSDGNVTVLFVTHDASSAQSICHRGIVLRAGKLVFDGSIDDAVAFYEDDE